MTPKEKAEDIVKILDVKHILKFGQSAELPVSMYQSQVVECAIIAVDEIIGEIILFIDESPNVYQSLKTPKKLCIDILNPRLVYWQEVKLEIQKLSNKINPNF